MADKLVSLADEDEARGRMISAGDKLVRASNYMLTAERLLAHGSEGRLSLYQRFLAAFEKGLKLSGSHAVASRSPMKASIFQHSLRSG